MCSTRAISRSPRSTCRGRTWSRPAPRAGSTPARARRSSTFDRAFLANANEALKEAGLQYQGKAAVKHMVEVLIEDFGYEQLGKPVVKPLAGLKFAGYVGCQTNRPFGIAGESFENPMYLDKLVETVGAEPVKEYDQKVTCCGGALAFSEPEKSQKQIRDIVESAYDHGADMIVTPCPLCQANVEVYQSEINRKQGTKLAMPVTYYSQLMTVAYGGTVKEAGLDGHIIQPTQLQELAASEVGVRPAPAGPPRAPPRGAQEQQSPSRTPAFFSMKASGQKLVSPLCARFRPTKTDSPSQ